MRLRDMSLRTVRRLIVAAVVLAVLAATVPLAVKWATRCGDRLARVTDNSLMREEKPDGEGECVGVTDGSYAFPGLEKITNKIAKENRNVEEQARKTPGDGDYVSLAYMTTFTLADDDSNSPTSVRRELEGAYLAQWRHNNETHRSPKIKLLIANMGSHARHWEHTVEELHERQQSEDHLVAVAGLGPSTKMTRRALGQLSGYELAMFAANMTSTDLHAGDGGPLEGFARVAPTNEDEARAAVEYLGDNYRTAMVVQDAEDPYARTLGEAFHREMRKRGRGVRTETYDSRVRTELYETSRDVCDQPQQPDVVYFAGRGRQLNPFLRELAQRSCEDLTVMTGDDTTNLAPEELAEAAENGITVVYTGLAHPDMWQEYPADDDRRQSSEFVQRQGEEEKLFLREDLREESSTIMGHDAVLTASEGIVRAAGEEVTGRAVGRMFRHMDETDRVPGASGFLAFHENGDPIDKAVPILRLRPDGKSDLIHVYLPS